MLRAEPLPAQARVVFAGTPDFSVTILEALWRLPVHVVGVLTAPDRPAGRGWRLQPSPVKARALAADVPVMTFTSLKTSEAQEAIASYQPDVMIVASYGYIIPAALLSIPRWGCVNVHASLLPRWRGAAPIHRALLAGDTEIGITIMQMAAGLDTGPMGMSAVLPLTGTETGTTLMHALSHLGAETMVRFVTAWQQAPVVWTPQPEEGVTYAHKIEKAAYVIPWDQPAVHIERMIRAFAGAPGAQTTYRGTVIKMHAAVLSVSDRSGQPGEILAVDTAGIYVATGDGVLCITALQKAGGRSLPVDPFVRGFPIEVSQLFASG